MPRLNYQTDAGVIGSTQVARAFVGLYGQEPSGTRLDGVTFRKSGSRRQAGIQVRKINLRIPDGPPTPSGAQPYRFASATVGTQSAWTAYVVGSSVDLKGQSYEIYGKSPEE